MTAITKGEAATSSFSTIDASRTTYCPDVAAIDDANSLLFDFTNNDFIRAVQNLPTLGAVQWIRGASIQALSYDYYGYTNYDAIILMFNGYISASHIPDGATVNLPNVSTLKSSLQVSTRGQIISI